MLGFIEFILFIISFVCFIDSTFTNNEFGYAIISLTIMFWIGKHWRDEYITFVEGNWKKINCDQLKKLDYIDNWYDDYNIPYDHQRYVPQNTTTVKTTTVNTLPNGTKVTTTSYTPIKTENVIDTITKKYQRKSVEKVGEPIVKHVERSSKLLTFFGVNNKTEEKKTETPNTTTTKAEEKTSTSVEVIMVCNNKRIDGRLKKAYDAIIRVLRGKLFEKTMFYNVLDSIKYIDFVNERVYVYIADKYILDNDDIFPKKEITESIKKEMGEHVSVNFLEYKVTSIKEYYQENKTVI